MTKNSFKFTDAHNKEAKQIIAQYPKGRERSAILALLDIAQRQNQGHLGRECIEYVADMIKTPHIRAYEVASFYTMFNLEPVGKYHIQICGTTPCWLRGAEEIKEACKKTLKIDIGETSKDKMFTLSEVECLGACVNAPMVQINDNYYEDLNPKIMKEIITKLKNGEKVKVGTQADRLNSAPIESKEAKNA